MLTRCMLGNFSCFCCRHIVCWLFSALTFQKVLSGALSECQTVWIQIRMYILSVLIWVQTVCKGYQQTTKIAANKEGVKFFFWRSITCAICMHEISNLICHENEASSHKFASAAVIICTSHSGNYSHTQESIHIPKEPSKITTVSRVSHKEE